MEKTQSLRHYYLAQNNFSAFILNILRDWVLYGPVAQNGNYYWEKITVRNILSLTIGKYRNLDSVKQFFFPPKEKVGHLQRVKTAIIGLKNCDLHLLKTADNIFLQGVGEDENYRQRRTNTMIISADCSEIRKSCFCTKMGLKPYPTEGFDINISPLPAGYLLEVATAAGGKIIQSCGSLLQSDVGSFLAEQRNNRQKIAEQVEKNNSDFSWIEPSRIIANSYDNPKWKEIAETCVECDGCRWACGSCYCFLLGEGQKAFSKIRSWDSCQSIGYGRVAGGANPRKFRWERLRNYYFCKLVYRLQNFGILACSGCGRCIEACPGKIDIRQTLEKIFWEKK